MTAPRLSLAELNAMSAAAFDAIAAPLFENAPWVTQGLATERPFASVTALHAAMLARLHAADDDTKLGFLRGHPVLSPATLRQGTTAESAAEQRSARIDALDEVAAQRLDAANAAYFERFGLPFILAVRGASLATILAAIERRATASPAAELAEALREVEAISWMRLLDRVAPVGSGAISLHVLDTRGRARRPAGRRVVAHCCGRRRGPGRPFRHGWEWPRRSAARRRAGGWWLRVAAGHRSVSRP